MRASVAYFAGAGTVIAAIAAGLGGGLLMANVIGPNAQKHEMTRLEQRMSSKPAPVSSEAGHQQAPVPYVGATRAASAPASAAADPPQHPANPPPQTNQASHAVKDAVPPARAATPNGPSQTSADTKSAESSTSNRENQAPTQPATQEQQATAPENANAMARDSDLKRAGDKKRTERRQQARRQRGRDQQDDQNQRDADNRGWNNNNGWRPGDRGWRDDRRWDDDSREIIVQRDYPDHPQRFGGPMRMGFPPINLFGPD